MKRAGVYVAALIAGFVGFYAGLFLLLTFVGLDAEGVAFGVATVGGAGLLAGVAASVVGGVDRSRGVGYALGGAVLGAVFGSIVDVLDGDAVWAGAVALVTATSVAAAVVGEGDETDPTHENHEI